MSNANNATFSSMGMTIVAIEQIEQVGLTPTLTWRNNLLHNQKSSKEINKHQKNVKEFICRVYFRINIYIQKPL